MSANKTHDVAVIGAGVFGAWIAHSLCRLGKRVILLDAYGPANSRASSGGESRIIRMGYGADEIYTRWSRRALPVWKELFHHRGEKLFHQTGVLWVWQPGQKYGLDTQATFEKVGVKFEKLSSAELEKRYPQIHLDADSWAIFEPESGVLMARRAVQAVVQDAVRNGVEYAEEYVEAPKGSGRLDTIRTGRGQAVSAGAFVFACGPWLPKVFPEILGNRIFPTRQEVYFFGTPAGDARFSPPAMPTWIALADEMYGMPDLESRGFKIALDRHGPAIDTDTAARLPSPELVQTVRSYTAHRFPALRDAPLVEARICQYENTSNGDFLVDRHPSFENVWLVGGGSGHGFKHGPSLGEYVARRLNGSGADIPRFSLATKQPAQERAVY